MTGSTPGPPRVSVVIPSLDEADNLEAVIPGVAAEYEVIVVEGVRYRRTSELLRHLRPDAIVVEQNRYGKGNALACGFAAATGDIIVMFDADGSADSAEIARFVDAVAQGADFAKGTRTNGGGSDDITVLRGIGNWGLTRLTNLLFRTRYSDLCYGFNAFRREVLPVLDIPLPDASDGPMRWGEGFEVETLINCRVARAGITVVEVPSHERRRVHGVSNLNAWRDGKRVLRTLLRERRRPPTRPTPSMSMPTIPAPRVPEAEIDTTLQERPAG
ncbi:glycosyltransferase family 2 protein [Micromonospora sp. NBC_01813]|uniref:glycosyltransferase family 2 protein n=1 Tax=Micromonospora sp. NBC_01813 TaxID=2975988 RepID=UPI002DDC6127|nr:glycosyltransferase family 2 protein [Micromonospora sp. NBC_01813]WSA10805.1 glycosyltransferase family 2 protein [Micromonospora sp. NBC_01813]